MEMTAAEWWGALGQVAVVTAISFIVLCLVTSLVRFQLMAEKANETEELGLGEEKEFRLRVMNAIAAARKAREPLTLALLRLPADGASPGEVEGRLRAALRSGDLVMSCGGNLLGLLLLCGSEKTEGVVRRLMQRDVAGDLPGHDRWRFGVAGYPEHGFKTSVLYPRALAMVEEAEKAGVPVMGMAPPDAVAEEKEAPADVVDPLTGLVREEKMIHLMRRYVARERQGDRAVSVAYLDIDQFERVSEQLGPEETSQLIKELAGCFNLQFREKDLLCRFGTSGFVVGMPVTPAVAVAVVQRVAAEVRKTAFKAGGVTKISLGAGVAGYPDVQGTAVQYFVAAELALQQARQRGRNQIVKYEPSMQAQAETPHSIDRL